MRKNIVAGNWKMNTDLQEGLKLANEINTLVAKGINNSATGVVIAPPFTHLHAISQVIDHNKVWLAAQNCATEAKGAFTGEVSVQMLKAVGVKAIILGHSERRSYYGETSETLLKKINLVLENGLKPIFCCGEVLAERESNKHFEVVKEQVESVLFTLSAEAFKNVIIAYEPVWAIGTGKTATSEQAQEIHAYIRKLIATKFGAETAENTTILYGGSCKASNAKELFSKPDVDGGLIGGASLVAEEFLGIINAF
ncbi:MAG: triose-phosphate isomerase [Bacteroidales bacterium]